MDQADLEAFRIVRTNLDYLDVDQRVKVVAVTSAMPEEGKSTVAASLAFASAAAGRKTLLVECDLRRPSLAGRLAIGEGPGLSEYLAGRAGPEDVLHTIHLSGEADVEGEGPQKLGESLVCIVAGEPPLRPAELMASRKFADFLTQVSEAYDLVVLDSAPLLAVVDTLEILPKVDGVLLCVRAGRATREQARAVKSAVSHLPDRPMGLVITGIRHGDEASYGYYYAST
jgi:receptor protein-tyrosine kinase